jgi:hypothetical protein
MLLPKQGDYAVNNDLLVMSQAEVDMLKARIDTLKYLHEHAYKRVVWYRAEIWKISSPLWAGFGGLLLAAWGTAHIVNQNKTIAIITFVIGGTLIALYNSYLDPLFKATRYCNDVVGRRERTLCRMLLMQKQSGFKTKGHINKAHASIGVVGRGDCDYGVWRLAKPGLQTIFPVVAAILLFAVCFNIWSLQDSSSKTDPPTTKVQASTTKESPPSKVEPTSPAIGSPSNRNAKSVK